jgi:hypothetical protein
MTRAATFRRGPSCGPCRPSPRAWARLAPVGDQKVMGFDEANSLGPESKRIYKWAPRCRICGHAMRGTVEVNAPAEGPNRGSFTMAVSAILCPVCRNDNFLGPFTSWLVVSGPLPVR